MKNLRDILIFFSVLGAVFVFMNVHFSTRKKQLNLCSPDEVASFSIAIETFGAVAAPGTEMKRTTTMKLVGEENPHWEVSQVFGDGEPETPVAPVALARDKADEINLDKRLILMCHLPYVEKFPLPPELTAEKAGLSLFGLHPPASEISLVIGRKPEAPVAEVLLSFGNDTPSGTEFYLRTSTEPEIVYTLPNRLRSMIFPTYLDLRNRNPFYALPEAKTLTLRFEQSEIRIEKDSSGWKIPPNPPFSKGGEVAPLIDYLEHFRYKNYFDEATEADFRRFGLDFPDIDISVEEDNGARTDYRLVRSGGRYYLSLKLMGKNCILILDHEAPSGLYQWLTAVRSGGSF